MAKNKRLVIIGGAEDKQGDCIILRRFLDLAGGKDASIAVITSATLNPYEVGNEYCHVFNSLGVKDVFTVNIEDRQEAQKHDFEAMLRETTGIFFTGGDQLRITGLIGGTKLHKCLHNKYSRGTVIAGTSAGASAMSEIMIIGGDNDSSPRRCAVDLAPGVGLLKGVVIDQHFAQRGRLGRLLSTIAQNPHVLGVGVDENTAMVVDVENELLEVIGDGAITIVDGRKIKYSNVSETSRDEVLALIGCTLHVLPEGFRFNLRQRRPLCQAEHKEEQ